MKAAKIYVRFLSTCVPDAFTKSDDWFSAPPFANLSDGKYLGSQLLIDDIVLTY